MKALSPGWRIAVLDAAWSAWPAIRRRSAPLRGLPQSGVERQELELGIQSVPASSGQAFPEPVQPDPLQPHGP